MFGSCFRALAVILVSNIYIFTAHIVRDALVLGLKHYPGKLKRPEFPASDTKYE